MMKVAQRGAVAPFHVMEVLREAWAHEATGADVIHLSVGQPAEEAPERVRRKAADMLLNKANMGYTNAMGLSLCASVLPPIIKTPTALMCRWSGWW